MNKKGSKHMTLEQRIQIEANLKVNSTCKHIAKEIGMDERTVSREIKLRRIPQTNGKYNVGKKDDEPCKSIIKFPFVCNGCKKRAGCFKKNKYFYEAKPAQEKYEIQLRDSRIGIDFEYDEKQELDKVLEEGIKQGQSVYHIVTSNPDKIKCSQSTVYRLINKQQTIVQRIDLHRAVTLRPRKKYKYKEDHKAIREGRKYIDFLREYSKRPFSILTEMDTVEGPKGQSECLLTLHITNTHFMMAKILKAQTKECVTQAFMELKQELGLDLYKKLFSFLLTDRGSEFCNPDAIEIDESTGERIANVYFCDSYASYQKGAIEENHTLLRYVIPKQVYFNSLTQDKVNLMMSHINSLCRKTLDGYTPYEATVALLSENEVKKTKVSPVKSDLVNVTSKLLK